MTELVPTTGYGSWNNIDAGSISPDQYVADSLGDFIEDYDLESLLGEFMAELQRRLPAGLTILGNGELIGPAYGPEADALAELIGEDRSATDYVKTIIDGEDGAGGIDLMAMAEDHDYTTGPYALTVGPRIGNGPDDYAPDSDVARHHKPTVYVYDDRRTLAQAKADALQTYGKATGLNTSDLQVDHVDENDPVVQDAYDTAEAGPTRPADRGPATILSLNALDLLHRTAISPSGNEFHIDGLRFDAGTGHVLIEVTVLDDEGQLSDDSGTVMDLRGWVIQ